MLGKTGEDVSSLQALNVCARVRSIHMCRNIVLTGAHVLALCAWYCNGIHQENGPELFCAHFVYYVHTCQVWSQLLVPILDARWPGTNLVR